MTKNEVNSIIDKEFKSFNDALFDLEPLPKDIIERFKVAIFRLPPKAHQLSSETVSKIIAKKVKGITNLDVPIIINAIQLLPMCELYKTIEEGLEKTKQIENIKIGYNILVQKLNHEMAVKRENMLKLSSNTQKPLKLVTAQA